MCCCVSSYRSWIRCWAVENERQTYQSENKFICPVAKRPWCETSRSKTFGGEMSLSNISGGETPSSKISRGETSWSKKAGSETSWTKTVRGRNDLVRNARERNVQVQKVRGRNVLGAKRAGPKGLGAKLPGKKCQGAKRPGPKCQGVKRPGPKCQGLNDLSIKSGGETSWSETSESKMFVCENTSWDFTSWLWNFLYNCNIPWGFFMIVRSFYYYHLNLMYDSLIGLTSGKYDTVDQKLYLEIIF